MQYPSISLLATHPHQWIYNVTFLPQRNVRVTLPEFSASIVEWLHTVQETSPCLVVGINVHGQFTQRADVLTLCCGDNCLLIPLRNTRFAFPEEFCQFLAQRNRWFVGLDIFPHHQLSLQQANPRLLLSRRINLRDIVLRGDEMTDNDFMSMAFGQVLVHDTHVEYGDWSGGLSDSQIFYSVMRAYMSQQLASVNKATLQIRAAYDHIAAGGDAAAAEAQAQAQYNAAALALRPSCNHVAAAYYDTYYENNPNN